jgi:hypothetical protein
VIFGVVLGPPAPTMVSVPTPPARSVVASRADAPLRTDAPLVLPSSPLIDEPASAGAASPRTPASPAETRVASRATAFGTAAPPVRVTRAAAKRTRIVTPRLPSFVIPVAMDEVPEKIFEVPAPAAPHADQPWMTALARVPVQAP